MLPGMNPQEIQRMMAMMALKNPEMLAQRAAAMGMRPPALPPGATPVATPPGAPTAGPTAAPPAIPPPSQGVSVQDYVAGGADPYEFQGDHLMPDPSMQYRGPIGAAGMPSHTGAAGMAGAPVMTPPAAVAPAPAPGMDLASAISAMGAIGAPTAATTGQFPVAAAPHVGGGMNPQTLAIMQALIGGARQPGPPTLGALMGAG